jgi:hypothetical protein
MKKAILTFFHVGTPKYLLIWAGLVVVSAALILGADRLSPKLSVLCSILGWLMFVASFVVWLVGLVAERREWQAKQQK